MGQSVAEKGGGSVEVNMKIEAVNFHSTPHKKKTSQKTVKLRWDPLLIISVYFKHCYQLLPDTWHALLFFFLPLILFLYLFSYLLNNFILWKWVK